ncbi:hypothetical protein E1B28_011728 [Marasmius oreades]|uniref:Protein-S-isoprenylcysteine O-methyltransferase n=1 Tax=Marasmius oreades TaxID=181124 RepID=A0A9P7RUW8_9AGAR|nr:uncharacterized protein E1B28_011728 [Marasmius oreades]KAG7090117.1 hypothetical protein E1B28_011728 [Marasmius oreades]
MRVATYVNPILRMGYSIATSIECLFIVTTYLNHLRPVYKIPLVEYIPLPTGISQTPGYTATLGLLIGIVGGLFRILCYNALGKSFTFNTTLKGPKLVTSGPYSLVRHPSYLAVWLISTGLTVYHLSPGSWVRESDILKHDAWKLVVGLWAFMAVFVTNVCLTMRTVDEDQLMKRTFGEEWETWRKVVRYRVLPGLF